jgi:hypothetical protein
MTATESQFTTADVDPLWLRIMLAAQTRIRALDLAGLADEAVLVRPVASDRDIGAGRSHALPIVEITPHQAERETAGRGNLPNTLEYAVQVTILATDRPDLPANLARWLTWREQIAAAFRHQPFADIDEVIDCLVDPSDAVQPTALVRQNLWASTLVLRFTVRGAGFVVLKYGSYTHALGEVTLAISSRPHFNPRGLHDATLERWEISGLLRADTPAALTTAIGALEAAYAVPEQNIGLYLANGTTPTSHLLTSASTLGGTRVVEGPDFPTTTGGEYSIHRSYCVVVEGLVPLSGAALDLLLREESITLSGGGPRFVYLQTIAGPPQRQQVAQATPYRVQQAGRAVGRAAYPLANSPLWPTAEHVDQRKIVRRTPRVVATTAGQSLTEFETAWQFEFESDVPLLGGPTTP